MIKFGVVLSFQVLPYFTELLVPFIVVVVLHRLLVFLWLLHLFDFFAQSALKLVVL